MSDPNSQSSTQTLITGNDSSTQVSLIDVWLLLVEYKFFFFAVFLFCIVLGVTYAYIKPITYIYSVSIEIGKKIEDGRSAPIESPDTVLAKLEEGYIPKTIYQYKESNPEDGYNYRIKTRIPRNSELVVMEAVGTVTNKAAYLKLLNDIVLTLKLDHDRITNTILNTIEISLNQVKLEIETLQERAKLFASKSERLDEAEKLLKKQLDELDQQISSSLRYRKDAVSEAVDQPQAMTVLLIDSELEKNRNRRANVEEQLYIEIKNERETLQQQLAINLKEQEVKVQEMNAFETRKLAVIKTRPLAEPTQSLLPEGPGKSSIAILAGTLGIFLGLITVFVTAFISKARQIQKSRELT